MSRSKTAKEVLVKLIVGAGQASPSPPVGPALGSKGVKSMDFCKVRYAVALYVVSCQAERNPHQEFNALTAPYTPGTPIPARMTDTLRFQLHLILLLTRSPVITIRPDRTFSFTLRTPPTSTMLLLAAGVEPGKNGRVRGANAPGRVPEPSPGDTTPTIIRASGSKNLALSAGGGVGMGTVKMVAKIAGGDKAAGQGGGTAQVGEVSLKHIYEVSHLVLARWSRRRVVLIAHSDCQDQTVGSTIIIDPSRRAVQKRNRSSEGLGRWRRAVTRLPVQSEEEADQTLYRWEGSSCARESC